MKKSVTEFPRERIFTVDEQTAGNRLDRAAAARCPDLSRSGLRRLIEEGAVRIDGEPMRLPARKVRLGQTVHVHIPEPDPAAPLPQALALPIVYADAYFVVIDKPAGMAAHPAPGTPDGTVVNALLSQLSDLSGVGGVLRPGIVHRLDKNTTGLMLVAKDDRTHLALSRQFAARSVHKVYLGITCGIPSAPSGRIVTQMARAPFDRKRMHVCTSGGKEAVTEYTVRETLIIDGARAALVEFRPQTGRTHQVRVHAAYLGTPLAGDPVYGGEKRPPAFSRHALHAHMITFRHPVDGRELTFTAPLPADMAELLTR